MTGEAPEIDPRKVIRVSPSGRKVSLAQAAAAAKVTMALDRRQNRPSELWIVKLASYDR